MLIGGDLQTFDLATEGDPNAGRCLGAESVGLGAFQESLQLSQGQPVAIVFANRDHVVSSGTGRGSKLGRSSGVAMRPRAARR